MNERITRRVPKPTALILAGAVAKGAFEAGVLGALADHAAEVPICRIIGTSSGALNGALYALGIRAAEEVKAARALATLWEQSGSWHNALKLDLREIIERKGLGTAARIRSLLYEAAKGLRGNAGRPIDLQLILTRLDGDRGSIGVEAATTYEHVARFRDSEFDSEGHRARIFETALGSAAFPGMFAPVDVRGIGLCIDGGAVNNTPIKLALGDGTVERVIVVTAQPLLAREQSQALSGLDLVSHFAQILVNERLYRDLRDAESVNRHLAELEALARDGVSPEVIQKVKAIFGWKPLELVQIRPPDALPGSAFRAFSNGSLRREYILAGREAAEIAIRAALKADAG
jgi:NTE family protein